MLFHNIYWKLPDDIRSGKPPNFSFPLFSLNQLLCHYSYVQLSLSLLILLSHCHYTCFFVIFLVWPPVLLSSHVLCCHCPNTYPFVITLASTSSSLFFSIISVGLLCTIHPASVLTVWLHHKLHIRRTTSGATEQNEVVFNDISPNRWCVRTKWLSVKKVKNYFYPFTVHSVVYLMTHTNTCTHTHTYMCVCIYIYII